MKLIYYYYYLIPTLCCWAIPTPVKQICSTWKMTSLSDYNKYISSNSNKHHFGFDIEYTIYDAFGMKYNKNPTLYIHNKQGLYNVTISDYLEQVYPNVVDMTQTNCLLYPKFISTIQQNIETYLKPYSTIANVTDITGQYGYTNFRYINLSSYIRNPIGCYTDIACITKYCFIRGKHWMYDPMTQLCYYPITRDIIESSYKNLFVNNCCNLI